MITKAILLALLMLSAATFPVTSQAQPVPLRPLPPSVQPRDYMALERTAPQDIRDRLLQDRGRISREHLTFEIGYTEVLDRPLNRITGLIRPTDVDIQRRDMIASEHVVATTVMSVGGCSPTSSAFDWSKQIRLTVRDQGDCGSCWAFAAVGVYEAAYAIANSGLAADGSEQDVMDCGPGSCRGGWYTKAWDRMVSKGDASEGVYPYQATDGSCRSVARPYRPVSWRYVASDTAAIKRALCNRVAGRCTKCG